MPRLLILLLLFASTGCGSKLSKDFKDDLSYQYDTPCSEYHHLCSLALQRHVTRSPKEYDLIQSNVLKALRDHHQVEGEAEFLGASYTQVMIAAAIPALFYYGALFAAIHFNAVRSGLKGLPREELPILGVMTSPGQPVYVKKGFKSVPRLALSGWIAHQPGNCCPEAFFWDDGRGTR